MFDSNVLFSEANRNTAAIMHFLESYLTPDTIEVVRQHIGDVLHDSRRRLLEMMEEDDEKADRERAI